MLINLLHKTPALLNEVEFTMEFGKKYDREASSFAGSFQQ